ncbi:MAG: hypothetical protein IT359_14940 [Gemmatimonadaceae bacterium]|nr:hypothetical protein [Gemmatimonadaceae bacterium]
MARRSFLLRVDPDVLDAVQRWANDDLRSLNGHIEYLLRMALRDAGRLPKEGREERTEGAQGAEGTAPEESRSNDTLADNQEQGS